MAGLLPQMSLEPAPGFRRFVECRYAALRRDACRLAGDGPHVDGFCSDVLSEVALRWRWFEVLRVRLRRPDPAGAYLQVALARRIHRWRAEPPQSDDAPREIEVIPEPAAGERPSGAPVPSAWPVPSVPSAWPDPPVPSAPRGRGGIARASAAARIAAVRPLPSHTPSAAVEAVIAWLHAYETYGRYRRVVAAAAALVVTAVLFRLRYLGGGR